MTDPNKLRQEEADRQKLRQAIKLKRARDHLNLCYETLGLPKKDVVYWDRENRVKKR